MSKEWKYIDRIGLEIEAAWARPRNDLIPDGSLRYEEFETYAICNEKGIDYKKCIGELVTKEPFSSHESLVNYLDKNYPDETHSRGSIHVHFSFKKIAFYGQLMNPKFQAHFSAAMKKWGEE